ncbi:MAG: hypothetical protein HKN23_09620 [Verrucomicrobiales bacterium]|nr:hypothetical protein [Verrucomicrobiales bacterium]
MKNRRFLQSWLLTSGIVCVFGLLGLLFFDRQAVEIAEVIFEPWFRFCEAVTPEAWQVRGNILLGLGWLISGIAVYSVALGGLIVTGVALICKGPTRAGPSD